MQSIVARERPEAKTDIADCRALDLGIAAYGECACRGPNDCPFAMPFGYAFLCHHPRLSEIMEHNPQALSGIDQG